MKIKSSDRITRFIRSDRHCKRDKISPDAFIPKHDSIDTSVSVTEGMDNEEDIWDIARNHLTTPIVARADITVNEILLAGLCVIVSEPPPRHADITPFPKIPNPDCISDEVNFESKMERRALANKLAAKSVLVKAPNKIYPLTNKIYPLK